MRFYWTILLSVLLSGNVQGQKDSAGMVRKTMDYLKNTELFKQIKSSITRNPIPEDSSTNVEKSEEAYKEFEGKYIRKIIINPLGLDTAEQRVKGIKGFLTRAGDALHTTTKVGTIRENLFFGQKDTINAYELSDNERYLRNLNFIVDARIVVVPVKGVKDSVDVLVVTKDIFSIGGSFIPTSGSSLEYSIYEANLEGMAQRIQLNGLIDTKRNPHFGWDALYQKNNILGSFINATIAYSELDRGVSLGDEREQSLFFRLDRPLISPYARWAGGLEISKNRSMNYYNTSDTIFRNYRYQVKDVWVGYNFSRRQSSRNRKFVSVRAYKVDFEEQPSQLFTRLDPSYNSRTGFIGAFTFFRQDFYKARFIYGFGRTEDIPYGFKLSLLAGVLRQFSVVRPYAGVSWEKSWVGAQGDFMRLSAAGGSFLRNESPEDIIWRVSGDFFSKLLKWKNTRLRHTLSIGYSEIFNRFRASLLNLNNEIGLRGFSADSLLGDRSLKLGLESVAFLPKKMLGFGIAPFAFTEVAFLTQKSESIINNPYFGLGAGVRVRNENLIFGTIELRMYYFPKTFGNVNSFKISIFTNLRFRYTTNFIQAPSFIAYD